MADLAERPSCPSSPSAARLGSQEPRRRVINGDVSDTEGPDACALARDVGLDLYPWQRLVMDDWCSIDRAGALSFVTCGLDVPRQNGKNATLEAYEVYRLAVCGWHVLHTAHRVKTAKKSFNRLVRYFSDEEHPEVRALVERVRRTNGEEAIFLRNGGSIEFSARTNGSSRGFDDIQLVVFDEAQELTDSQYDAIMYTLSASSSGERQVIYTGTPPNETCPGTVFARARRAALDATPRGTTWSSWATPELPRRDATFMDVLEDVYLSNPSMGYLLSEEFTETEFAGSSLTGFAHERLDWFSPVLVEAAAIPRKLWDETAIEEIGGAYPGRVAFGVKFSADGTSYALVGCKLLGGHSSRRLNAAVELLETGSTDQGLGGLARFLHSRRQRASVVVVDGLNGAEPLCSRLADMGVPRGYVVRPRTGDVIAASSVLLDSLRDKTVAHTPSPELDESATKSVRRAIGSRGGWGFGSGSRGGEPWCVEAAALALWGARTTRRNPKRKQRLL